MAKIQSPFYVSLNMTVNALHKASYTKIAPLKIEAWTTKEPVSFEDRKTGDYIKQLKVGSRWAKETFDCAWLHCTGTVPDGYENSNIVYMLTTGGEGLVYTVDGKTVQGITCYALGYDPAFGYAGKKIVQSFCTKNVEFWIDSAANTLFGKLELQARIRDAHIAVCNEQIRALSYDLEVLKYSLQYMKKDDYSNELHKVLSKFIGVEVGITEEKAAKLRRILKPHLEKLGSDNDRFEYYAIGHAHLDLAWLWPIRETKRKGARTFTTQLHNIERYPDYIFGASQAQLYEWMRDNYPAIYEKVKKAVEDGRWELQGATWVEMDSNLTGPESLIRQFYYGKKYYKDEFSQNMEILWLPDSFGYSACLPQVMKLADVPYFLTQKMSWNTVNKFPYHTFKWVGLDGTEVFAHMLPEDTYNSPVRSDLTVFGEKNYKERKISNKSIMLYGIGDGGGGPGYEHLERLSRNRDLYGVPKITPMKAIDAFKILDDKSINYPVYSGELYLERHRGTYTTRGANKRCNRKCEFALANYEKLLFAARDRGIDVPIDEKRLETLWKEVLLYQFHDILPGSSINRVYDETAVRYEAILTELDSAVSELSQALFGKGMLNLTSFDCVKTVKKNGEWYKVKLPAMSFVSEKSYEKFIPSTVSTGDNFIENENYRVEFSKGVIVSLLDKKQNREYITNGKKAGVFSVYDDMGDCWDIKKNYAATKKDASFKAFKITSDGANARAVAEFTFSSSKICVEYTLGELSDVLDISINTDWHENKKMLRCAFPFAVKTDEAAFNIQYGHLYRSTKEDNKINKAQFEVSAQKFVDMSENDFGVSLINDCKYGYRVKNGVIDIDLVRSPKGGPGKVVDQGEHKICLSVFTHKGKVDADVYKQAYLLNNKPVEIDGNDCKDTSLYSSSNENIVLEALKLAEDGSSVILHLYNSSESSQSTELCLNGYSVKCETGICENDLSEIQGEIIFRPFELKLVRFVRNKEK